MVDAVANIIAFFILCGLPIMLVVGLVWLVRRYQRGRKHAVSQAARADLATPTPAAVAAPALVDTTDSSDPVALTAAADSAESLLLPDANEQNAPVVNAAEVAVTKTDVPPPAEVAARPLVQRRSADELNWFQRRQLARLRRAQATQAYLTARGTRHRKALSTARDVHVTQRDRLTSKKRRHENDLKKLKTERDKRLRRLLERHIVDEHLHEIRGVGPSRHQQLVTHVFKGKLHDLTKASLIVEGIGQQTQMSIDAWVRQHERELPTRMKKTFPGKEPVEAQFLTQTESLERAITKVNRDLAAVLRTLKPIEHELAWLTEMTEQTFVRAVTESPDKAARYVRGVYAPWEEAPAWFTHSVR